MQFRVGLGHDTHRLAPVAEATGAAGPVRPLVVGGVFIPHELGLIAHSDGDVLLHALLDALLGAVAWGDIGEWFPDNDPQYDGVCSSEFLRPVLERYQSEGWSIVNVDAIVFAQQPKLLPFKPLIVARIAELLAIPANSVNVKAKTGERVGPIGREEAISAEVVVLVQRLADPGSC